MSSSELGAIGWHCFLAISLSFARVAPGAPNASALGGELPHQHSENYCWNIPGFSVKAPCCYGFNRLEKRPLRVSCRLGFLDVCFRNGGWGFEKPNWIPRVLRRVRHPWGPLHLSVQRVVGVVTQLGTAPVAQKGVSSLSTLRFRQDRLWFINSWREQISLERSFFFLSILHTLLQRDIIIITLDFSFFLFFLFSLPHPLLQY